MVLPLKGFIFLCKNGLETGRPFRNGTTRGGKKPDAFSFLREAKQSDYTGGAEHAGKSNLSLHGVQTAQLQHHEEQEKRS